MAQEKSRTASPQQDVEQLSQELETLKRDLSEISRTIAHLGSSTRDAAKQRVRETAGQLRHRGEQGLKSAQQQAEEFGQHATDAVRNQPALAVGVAVGLGFLLGYLSGRK